MSDNKIKQRFYPLKPKKEEGFKKAVAWLGGREMVASLKGVILYGIYGENMDPRSWMKPNIYPNVEEKIKFQEEEKLKDSANVENKDGKQSSEVLETQAKQRVDEDPNVQKEIKDEVDLKWAEKIFDYWEWKRKHFKFWEIYLEKQKFWKKLQSEKAIDEFWFDYIADSGDGQMGVYGVGCLCLSDLWLDLKEDDTGAKIEQVGADVKIIPPRLIKEENGSAKIENLDNYKLLPRGNFLFVGGDTAYHSANHATLFERFQTPFRWAFMSVRKLASQKDRYVLKKKFLKKEDAKKHVIEKKFLVSCEWKNVFKPGTNDPVDNWDGTIGDIIDGKEYWDTEPLRPLFGIPANHDYYDSIDGFNKQFRRAPFEEIEENMVYDDDKGRMLLQIPTFSREQEASYIAIRLPFSWWMFGIDSENEKLDYRQEVFFKQIMKRQPKKLILTTPEPTTVFGKLSGKKDKTATYLNTLTLSLGLKQPFLNRGKFAPLEGEELEKYKKLQAKETQYGLETKERSATEIAGNDKGYCRLDLSGDVHHYARYWGENTRKFEAGEFSSGNYASLVAGGGGAFFDPTETLIGRPIDSNGKRVAEDGVDKKKVRGEIPPQKIYPEEKDSREKTADRLFDLWNIKKGGYVQTAGAVFAVIIYSLLMHFSNASLIYRKIRENGIGVYFTLSESFTSFFLYSDYRAFTPFISGFILTGAAVLVGMSVYKLNTLIENLKKKFFEEEIDKNKDGRLTQLGMTFIPFAVAVVFYIAFLIFLPVNLHPFTKSYFLFVHFVISGMIVWLSMDYSNWLPVRFKISRSLSEKTFIQMVEDPNEETDKWYFKVLGQLSREYAYKYFPAHMLVIFSVFVLISGIRLFGNGILSSTLADLVLLVVILGNIAMISFLLAVKTGAAYYKGESGYEKKYRFYFLLIGMWHALLQILTPFIFYFYTNIYLALLITVIVFFVNGFPVTSERLKIFFAQKDKEAEKRSLWYRIFSFQAASELMKHGRRVWITTSWIIYGLIFLALPFAVLKNLTKPVNTDVFHHSFTLYQLVEYLTPKILFLLSLFGYAASIIFSWMNPAIYKTMLNLLSQDYNRQAFFLFSVLIVAYLGYYLSRVWFSWYLAVSLIFNGHNNEAGGAARIEGFKHILRIRVEREKLTVYVIGFDEAKPEIDQLSLRLVDKFTLECKPIE